MSPPRRRVLRIGVAGTWPRSHRVGDPGQGGVMTPRGPFDLLFQNRFFNGWPTLPDDPGTIAMAFPVEGWAGSAAVLVRQDGDDVEFDIRAPEAVSATAAEQALAALSLDVDGSAWPAVGERNDLVGRLQREYRYLRP